ncbi:MAG: CBS domain-containing protein [Bacteroidota bacterium]
MGEQKVLQATKDHASFTRHLLDDISALEYMLENNLFEKDIVRIGAEQEFCLVDTDWRPANNSVGLLQQINDPHFTTELAKYNLEINLDPFELKGNCFRLLEDQLLALLAKARVEAKKQDTRIVLTGILPTISKNQLDIEYLTPKPRYHALNETLTEMKQSHFQLHLQGVDELNLSHNSVLFEACNTSFQMHLQIEPNDFVASFNWAQAIAGPVLSICTNSPLLLGRELWDETRIALFRQSIDTRTISMALKEEDARVSLGIDWAKGSPADIFKDNIARYKIILTKDIDRNSMEVLENGRIPKLKALNIHNGTIYPWNRACYGVGNGKAHLRIENRYIPSGPSVKDEMANFAFWVGIMTARPKEYDDMSLVMDFKDAKSNFIKAARYGKDALLTWGNKKYEVPDLMEEVMLPLAYKGLGRLGIDTNDIDELLGIIQRRITGTGGSQWITSNYRRLRKLFTRDTSLRLITKAMHTKQQQNTPVDQWSHINEAEALKQSAKKVGHIMSTQLLTVNENDLADLATHIMQWNDIHHVPVEDENGKLTGLLTWNHAEKFKNQPGNDALLVKDIMEHDVVSVSAKTRIKEAIRLMKENEFGCLPITQNNELVGIITIKDVIAFDHD